MLTGRRLPAWLAAALSGVLWAPSAVWAIGAVCNPAGDALARAQCTIDAAGQTGAGNPGAWTATQVPGFVTDTPPETGYFDTSGNPAALDAAAAAAAQSPQADDLRNKRDQAAGWDLSQSPPVETARAIAQQPADPGLSRTCQTTTTCISWQQTPNGGGACQTPGTSQATCLITTDVTITHAGPLTGSTDWMGVGGIENAVWVRLRKGAPGLYYVDVGNGNNTNSCGNWNVPWTQWTYTLDLRGSFPAGSTVLNSWITMTVEATGGGCGWGSGTFSDAYQQYCRILNCDAGGMQWPSIRIASYSFHADVQEPPTTADACAPYQQLAAQGQATLQEDLCLDATPATRVCDQGHSYLIDPPGGCWRRQQTWLYTTQIPDTCRPYREQGCAQTSSACGQRDAYGNCEYYNNEYTCYGSTCAAEQTVQVCATCGNPQGLVPFCLDDATPPDQSLAKTAAWLQVLQNAQDQWDPNSLTIFRGDRVQCVHGTGFGNLAIDNCCADPPQGGSCTQTDWDAYAARREKRAHYVGQYCSNWVNFFVGRTCVEITQVWCAFPTSFARIIHEQGRPALPRGWGSAESPDCGPFTIDEFQRLPWNSMDFSEVYDQLVIQFDQQGITQQAQQAAAQATGR
ncbi:conjugal transfer protein TraN [Nitrospira calida]|jgi:hypothetical protein